MRFILNGLSFGFLIVLAGCVESSFNLAPDSRLPKWFAIPDGMSRNELHVTMDYYVKPSGREAIFKLFDDKGKILRQVTGLQRGIRPIELKNPPAGFEGHYPSYEVITVDGVTDIVEHRKMEPVFYITDDPNIWKELEVDRQQ